MTDHASNTALIVAALISIVPSTLTALTVLFVVLQGRKHGRTVEQVKETLDAHVSEEEGALLQLNRNTRAIEKLGNHIAPGVPFLSPEGDTP